eukprot:GHVO01022236.1.p1 GENE.GHVO01022236.1~~GHVO01022236.1.p1  ORF type:complete len:240 (-),score=27.19 GHVO01022236.1:104-775(-)
MADCRRPQPASLLVGQLSLDSLSEHTTPQPVAVSLSARSAFEDKTCQLTNTATIEFDKAQSSVEAPEQNEAEQDKTKFNKTDENMIINSALSAVSNLNEHRVSLKIYSLLEFQPSKAGDRKDLYVVGRYEGGTQQTQLGKPAEGRVVFNEAWVIPEVPTGNVMFELKSLKHQRPLGRAVIQFSELSKKCTTSTGGSKRHRLALNSISGQVGKLELVLRQSTEK